MKKKLVGAITGLLASALIAAPVNNPASSAQFESGLFTGAQADYTVRVGYVGDFVANRRLSDKTTNSNLDGAVITRSGAVVTLGLFDRFDLSFGGGGASFSSTMRNAGNDVSRYVDNGSFWTMDARGILWTQDNCTVNAFAGYTHTRGDVNAVRSGGLDTGHTAVEMTGWDWQLGLGVSHTIQVSPDMSVIPSLSVRYSDGAYKFGNNRVFFTDSSSTVLSDLEARGNFGIGAGVGLYAGKVFGLTFEGQFMDSTGFALTADIRI